MLIKVYRSLGRRVIHTRVKQLSNCDTFRLHVLESSNEADSVFFLTFIIVAAHMLDDSDFAENVGKV